MKYYGEEIRCSEAEMSRFVEDAEEVSVLVVRKVPYVEYRCTIFDFSIDP